MNDYISKPVDEDLLYRKMIGLLKKPILLKNKEKENTQTLLSENRTKYVDLTYLKTHTKANPKLMMEMIALYLKQTPPLINAMKQSLNDKDWNSLFATAHKMIPSFSIMGIHKDFEEMAKKIQEYSHTQQHLDEVEELILQLETICSQACKELKEEYDLIEKKKK